MDKIEEILRYFSRNIYNLIMKKLNEKENLKNKITEIRIRVGKPIILKTRNKDIIINYKIDPEEILDLLGRICENSIYAYKNQICEGFLTIKGGHRIGITGTVIIEDNKIININYISSLNCRIAREVIGCSKKILNEVLDIENHTIFNTVIVSPPGKGKTTILRDLIRNLSNGTKESSGSIMQALSRLEETSAKMMDSIAQTIELIQLNIEKVSNVNKSVTKITNDAATLGENIKIVDSAVKEVETSNKTLTDNMNQVGAVMNDMTESINKAELTTRTMLSKYESSAKSAMDIEDVVGKLMEELGVGGFMGVQDVRSGMKISISNVNGVKKEYSGEVVERNGNELYITVDEKDSELFDKKDKHTRCNFNIVVDNVLYYWENISIRHSKAAESGEYKLYIESNPQVHNRRKYPRMPIANACTIKFENDDKTYNGRMVNVSANGFAFSVCDSAFVNAKDKNIIVSVDNFDEICTNPLEGCIIRCSNNDGEYTVGCRMPEDIISIKHYVNKNYCN